MNSYPVTRPTAPGLYESEILGDLVKTRVNAEGSASVLIEVADVSYESAIRDLNAFAGEYGPFRRLDDEPSEPV